jgi:hypothetical protein
MNPVVDTWRAAARKEAEANAVDLTLPSGTTIRARRPGLAMMVSHTALPMGLANLVRDTDDDDAGSSNLEAVDRMMAFTRDVLTNCVISPRIPDDILPSEIPNGDIDFLIAWALRGEEAARLATFRAERRDAGSDNNGSVLSPKAEHDAGDRRSGVGSEPRSGGGSTTAPAEFRY